MQGSTCDLADTAQTEAMFDKVKPLPAEAPGFER